MNEFEKALAKKIGPARLAQIQKASVGIAGAGGLGSNCAVFLVRSGFKRFTIVDFDVVEWSNLNRQFFFADQVGQKKVAALRDNLLRINPDLELEMLAIEITPENVRGIFAACDVVVEAFDEVAGKKLLMETYGNSGKLFVCASGLAGWGNADDLVTRRIGDRVFLVGDQRTAVSADCPPLAPRTTVAAAKEANVVLSWVIGEEDGPAGIKLVYG